MNRFLSWHRRYRTMVTRSKTSMVIGIITGVAEIAWGIGALFNGLPSVTVVAWIVAAWLISTAIPFRGERETLPNPNADSHSAFDEEEKSPYEAQFVVKSPGGSFDLYDYEFSVTVFHEGKKIGHKSIATDNENSGRLRIRQAAERIKTFHMENGESNGVWREEL